MLAGLEVAGGRSGGAQGARPAAVHTLVQAHPQPALAVGACCLHCACRKRRLALPSRATLLRIF